MNAVELRRALQFGNGGRLNDRSGIGRFGMGLPNSSISQARRVDVWTWQNGYQNAVYSYLDVGEIEHGQLSDVPSPKADNVPKEWIARSDTARTSISGTLVLWSDLDKCDWRTAKSIFKNSEFAIGRIYSYFLKNKKLRIRMADFYERATKAGIDEDIQPNDPLYLAPDSTLPAPWNSDAMFEPYGDIRRIEATLNDVKHIVTVRFSVAKKVPRDGHNAGDQPHGKHAKNNVGVSVVRAERELELQSSWCNQYDHRERW